MKDADELVKLFKANGFTLARNHNHQIWRCPCKHIQITIPKSGGKGRGHGNAASKLRREARICKANLEEKP